MFRMESLIRKRINAILADETCEQKLSVIEGYLLAMSDLNILGATRSREMMNAIIVNLPIQPEERETQDMRKYIGIAYLDNDGYCKADVWLDGEIEEQDESPIAWIDGTCWRIRLTFDTKEEAIDWRDEANQINS